MTESHVFKMSLIISIGIHTLLLVPYGVFIHPLEKIDNSEDNIHITYHEFSAPQMKMSKSPLRKEEIFSKPVQVEKKARKPLATKEQARKNIKHKNSTVHTNIDRIDRLVDTPVEKFEKDIDIDVPSYERNVPTKKEISGENKASFDSYYLKIRSSIGKNVRRAYVRSFQEGVVTIKFVVDRRGKMLGQRIVDIKGADKYLQDIALTSIKNASPFPPFPDDLRLEQILFDIKIHFRKK